MEDEGIKRVRGRTRGGGGTSGRSRGKSSRGRTRGRTKKTIKVIESDDEDMSTSLDESAMDTSHHSSEHELEKETVEQQVVAVPQIHNKQNIQVHQTHPHAPHPKSHLPQQQINEQQHQHFDLEADISQLEPPTFTTINRGPPELMLRLRWDHRVNLIGEKVLNPMIHCCDKCSKPILIYGRMIPCKHVFCLSCGKKEDKVCPRCMEKVSRVEQTGLGTVFMCTHGGTRYGNAGCRRTYLSQRDLQAHINHRHVPQPAQPVVQNIPVDTSVYAHSKQDIDSQLSKVPNIPVQNSRMKSVTSHMVQPIMGNDPRVNSLANQSNLDHRSQHRSQSMMNIQNYSQVSVTSSSSNAQIRSNLITVPIQDTTVATHDTHQPQQQSHHYYQAVPPQVTYSGYNMNVATVPQTQQYYTQAQHATAQHLPQHTVQHTPQMTYASPAPQQQYGSPAPTTIRNPPTGYIPDSQYGPPPTQVPPPPQTQWNQHQQQFYR